MLTDPRLRLPAATSRLEYWIPGPPMGKPRQTRSDKWKKRKPVVDYRGFKDLIKIIVADTLPKPEQVVRVNWIAYHEIPRSWSRKKAAEKAGTLKRSTPDRDNVDKAILDALWGRDEAIAWGEILKVWCPDGQEPGIRLEIETFAD